MRKTYFPIRIRIVATGEETIVVKWQDVPKNITFTVLETNVKC